MEASAKDIFSGVCDEYQRLKWVVTQSALDTYSASTKTNWRKSDLLCWKQSVGLVPDNAGFPKVDLVMECADGVKKVFGIHEFILNNVSELYNTLVEFKGSDD